MRTTKTMMMKMMKTKTKTKMIRLQKLMCSLRRFLRRTLCT